MEPYINAQITIIAPIEKVWDALVNPEMTSRYMFGCRVVTDWQPGSTVDWIGEADGKQITFVTGKAITFEPYNTLVYSVIDPLATYPHTPENHLIVTCHLSEDSGITTLSITQGNYTTVADGETRYGHGAAGWDQLLGALKGLLETQQ